MNFLCHFALESPDPQRVLGQFLGDFARGPLTDLPYPPGVIAGIAAHRRLDAISGQHTLLRMAKDCLAARERRFAGIVLDLYCDTLLMAHWPDLLQEDPDPFFLRIERVLRVPSCPLPPAAAHFAQRMLDHDLLRAYADVNELPEILDRMGSRLRQPSRLSPLLLRLRQKEDRFLRAFPSFFGDLQQSMFPPCAF